MSDNQCFHCGLQVSARDTLHLDGKSFCCNGCRTVYEIFTAGGLSHYYDFQKTPGAVPLSDTSKYEFLANEAIVETLLEFNESGSCIVSLHIPHIHCSSCIWILENLRKLRPGILSSQVNFHEKKVRVHFHSADISLKEVVTLLSTIGYEPNISLGDYDNPGKTADRSLTYKLGIAFFCFGNIMLLSFPEYFEHHEFWLDRYRSFFRWLIFLLSLPSFLYSASGYYRAAWQSLRAKMLNIEVPIALGIIVMFVRSVADLISDHGPGFFDSMTGLIFFMLLGKMFQAKTYKFLNFERDFKSYFPIAVTRKSERGGEENVPVYDLGKGDRLLIRNHEIIPADGILISESAAIDYSFVTGEALPVSKSSGDRLFAGGRLSGAMVEMEVIKPVSQSYLTQLWGNKVFSKQQSHDFETITNRISHYFTPVLLLIALSGWGYWIRLDSDTAFNVFTAVLIVACPCALALTAPFTLGNILRIMGRHKFYLKNTMAIEQLSKIDTIVFDKTGTITTTKAAIVYSGNPLAPHTVAVASLLRQSGHPFSRMLYDHLGKGANLSVEGYEEIPGRGISGRVAGCTIQIGSPAYVGLDENEDSLQSVVCIAVDGSYFGKFTIRNQYRPEAAALFASLGKNYNLKILSGDNEGERPYLEQLVPTGTEVIFNRKPQEKLSYIESLQLQGHRVMMVGDGLNDAGALMQSHVGVAISENTNVFSPACDAILDALEFGRLEKFLKLSKKAITIIRMSFGLSLAYNVVGLYFAVTGNLLPIVAAIIMPLSTITIISFVTVAGNYAARGLKVRTVSPKRDTHHILPADANIILKMKTTV
ncbi:heavy metal translocating P-type ATPase [Flavobacterium magnum]|uniref:Heavy metal translocating P-type ATPase n=1 Tax=Flavobacterium magnum TaxID=2162713 RepID=A0A2S0RG74_9FLAO|nr:heavy metal translocating P-type ATPase metal-binding domain-containing protein [Flavobacterium magnum]AWA30927.1 heavy metal translocating P-type ATPase [Flavobacterium magnum]